MSLWDVLSTVGAVLDTPGSIVRNTLAGQNPLKGLFAPEERTYGRDLLEQYGLLGENQDGLDWGDVAGFGVDLVSDPFNAIGGLGIAKRIAQSRAPALKFSARRMADDVYEDSSSILSANPGDTVAKALSPQGDELGRVVMQSPEKPSFSRLLNRGFPQVAEDDVVARVSGAYLDNAPHGHGIGQQMYLDAMANSPAKWFYNSGNSGDATRAIEALRRKGLANVHWKNKLGGPRIMGLTDEGRAMAGTGGLLHNRRYKINDILGGLLAENALVAQPRYFHD